MNKISPRKAIQNMYRLQLKNYVESNIFKNIIMTLEAWASNIGRPVRETHPQAWLLFVSYIMITTISMLNLFIAIIVHAMQAVSDSKRSTKKSEAQKTMQKEIHDIVLEVEHRLLQKMENFNTEHKEHTQDKDP